MTTKARPPAVLSPSPTSSERERMVQDLCQYTSVGTDAIPLPALSPSPSSPYSLTWWKSVTAKELRLMVRVQALPRKVLEKIALMVVRAAESERVINPSYRPPTLLAVSHFFRKFHAESYYKGLTATFNPGSDLMAMVWLNSLPRKHRNYLKEVKFIRSIKDTCHEGEDLRDYMRFRRSMMWRQLFDWIQYHIPTKWKQHIREAIRFEEHVRTPDGTLHVIRV